MMARRPLSPTRQDIAAFRRLLEEARACANNPSRATGDLFARTCSTAKAVVPTGKEERANPWFQLRDAAVVYCARKGERRVLAADLLAKVQACATELADVPGASPRRFRADVDG